MRADDSSVLHDADDGHRHRGTAEVEAENAAYLICHADGLAWADGKVTPLSDGGQIASHA